MRQLLPSLLTGLLLCFSALCFAQQTEDPVYYLNINDLEPGYIYRVNTAKFGFEFNDKIAQAPDMTMRIMDHQHRVVSSSRLDKNLGLNHYALDTDLFLPEAMIDSMFYFEFAFENRKKISVPVMRVQPENFPLSVSIMVVPVENGCENLTTGLTEFYSQINGGRAPYQVNWYVLNEAKTDFLFQPREEHLTAAEQRSKVIVEYNPAFSVALYIKDACGKEDKQIVTLTCDQEKQSINTIFFEELDQLPTSPGQ